MNKEKGDLSGVSFLLLLISLREAFEWINQAQA
jgi:hypothetical protein